MDTWEGKNQFSVIKPAIKSWQTLSTIKSYLKLAKFHGKLSQGFTQERRDQFLTCWAQDTLKIFGVSVDVLGELPDDQPAIYVGNHISYLDIPLLMACKPVVFVAKKEISRWPFIGSAGEFIGVVYVNRSSFSSRQKTAKQIAHKVVGHNERVALFPAGTTSIDNNIPWRAGAFRIAQQHQIPIQPFRIHYDPLRTAAYINRDTLLPHLFQLLQKGQLRASIEFGEKRMITDHRQDMKQVRLWCQSAREGLLQH